MANGPGMLLGGGMAEKQAVARCDFRVTPNLMRKLGNSRLERVRLLGSLAQTGPGGQGQQSLSGMLGKLLGEAALQAPLPFPSLEVAKALAPGS